MRILLARADRHVFNKYKPLWFSTSKKFRRNIPLTLAQLVAITPKKHEIDIVDEEQYQKVNTGKKYDLVAITAFTKHAYRAYDIADEFRRKNIPVVLGGYHASLLPDEAKQHADSVVIGEAEQTWPQLLEDFENKTLKTFYKADSHIDSENIPSAFRGNLSGYAPTASIQATRGCPFNCEYCAIHKVEGGCHRKRPIENVIEEIKEIKRPFFSFYDPSLTINVEYTKSLFRELRALKKHFVCHGNINVLNKNEDLIKLSAKAGCTAWFVGFESLSQDSLESVGKANKVEYYASAIKKIRRNGVAVKGLFMFGLDYDPPDCFSSTLKAIKEWHIDMADFTILTPYPGTKIYEKLERDGRILTKDWSKYDNLNVVFKPKNITPSDLKEKTYAVMNSFNSISNITQRLFDTKNLDKYSLISKYSVSMFDRNYWIKMR